MMHDYMTMTMIYDYDYGNSPDYMPDQGRGAGPNLGGDDDGNGTGDDDGNGALDNDEVSTTTVTDNPSTASVDERGRYSFVDLVPDDYTVAWVTPSPQRAMAQILRQPSVSFWLPSSHCSTPT